MKTFLTLAVLALCSIAFTASAAKAGKVTDEQKALLEKYDTDKNGKLDKKERAGASGDDKAKLEAAFPAKKKK